jgi:hypothetical protein
MIRSFIFIFYKLEMNFLELLTIAYPGIDRLCASTLKDDELKKKSGSVHQKQYKNRKRVASTSTHFEEEPSTSNADVTVDGDVFRDIFGEYSDDNDDAPILIQDYGDDKPLKKKRKRPIPKRKISHVTSLNEKLKQRKKIKAFW